MLAEYEKTPWKSDFPGKLLTQAEPHRKDCSPSMINLQPYERYLSRVCKVLEAAEAASLILHSCRHGLWWDSLLSLA